MTKINVIDAMNPTDRWCIFVLLNTGKNVLSRKMLARDGVNMVENVVFCGAAALDM